MSNEIRNAVLLAADYIEKFPSEFDFFALNVPTGKHCGSPGCALGWIAHFMGHRLDDWSGLVGVGDIEFYERMDAFEGHDADAAGQYGNWKGSAELCAKALRQYAEAYLPASN